MRKYLLFWLNIVCISALMGQAVPPRFGYALSGGGAKGLAHIGVLKVLEENGIYPEVVTGTSMGSIVGGLYSIGYSPADLETFATTLNWDEYFTDSYPRSFLPVEEKARADRYILTLALENGKLNVPRGLIQGKKIQNLFSGITASAHDIQNFNNFCLPFSCIATDLETGDAVVISSGSLAWALRSSMSIPSAFEPVEYGDRLLVDGYVVRNLPVRDAINLGADLVLGVDVGSMLYKREDLTSVLSVLDQTSSFGYAASTKEQRALADFLIVPELDDYSTVDYGNAKEIIAQGETSAREALPDLLAFMDAKGIDLPMQKPDCPKLQRDSFWVSEIKFIGDQPSAKRTLEKLIDAKLPQLFTVDQLNNEIGRLYASGFFKLVEYELIPIADGYQLVLKGTAAPAWYVRAGLNFDTDFNFGLLLNATGRNIGFQGAILSADFRLSENPALFLDYLIYTRSSPSVGLKWHGSLNTHLGKTFEDFKLVDEFSFRHFTTRLSFLSGITRTFFLETGLFADRLSLDRKFFKPISDESISLQTGLFLKLSRDTYDRTYFPTEGSITNLRFQWSFSGRLEEKLEVPKEISLDNNLMITARLNKVFPLGKSWWLSWINAGGLIDYQERSFINQLFLGREVPAEEPFFEIMGLRLMEQPVTTFVTSGLQLRTSIGKDNFVGFQYNALWHASSEFSIFSDPDQRGEYTSDWYHGFGLVLGTLTRFGPLRFTTEYNPYLSRFNFSLFAGYRF